MKGLLPGAAVLSVVTLGSAQFGGLNQDVADQAANTTRGEYDEQPDEVTQNVAYRLDAGTQTELVVKGQEHTFEAVFVNESEGSGVIRVDGQLESVGVGDEVIVSNTEFEISSLGGEGSTTGTIEVRGSVQGGDIELGERNPIRDETGAGDAEDEDTRTETPEEEASGGSGGTGRVSPPQQQPGGSAESDVNERITTINRSFVNLATVVERQQERINSLEDRIERLETGNTGDRQPSEGEPEADNGSQGTQKPEPRAGGDAEDEGILSPITGLVS